MNKERETNRKVNVTYVYVVVEGTRKKEGNFDFRKRERCQREKRESKIDVNKREGKQGV